MVTECCWPPIYIDYRLSINRTRFSNISVAFPFSATIVLGRYINIQFIYASVVFVVSKGILISFFFFLLLKTRVVCFHSIKSLQWNNELNIYIDIYKYIKYTEIEIHVLLFKK